MARRRRQNSNGLIFGIVFAASLIVGMMVMIPVAIFVLKVSWSGSSAGANSATAPSQVKIVPTYSSRFSEEHLPAERAAGSTPLRSHQDHPWVKLVAIESQRPDGSRVPYQGVHSGERLVVNYESSANLAQHPSLSHGRVYVQIQNDRGDRVEWTPDRPDRFAARGGWYLDEMDPFRPGPDLQAAPPNVELFVVLEDTSNPQSPMRFKISNSLVIGELPQITLARSWSEEETPRIDASVRTYGRPAPVSQPITFPRATNHPPQTGSPPIAQPPASPQPQGATEAAADDKSKSVTYGTPGGWAYDLRQAGQPMLGFRCDFGSWASSPSIRRITPVYAPAAVPALHEQVFAKEGYAVGGLHVEVSPYVSGVQAIFMRLEADGRLNPKDQYLSEWVRAKDAQGKDYKGKLQPAIVSDGRPVIGVHCGNGAIVNTIGLVFE